MEQVRRRHELETAQAAARLGGESDMSLAKATQLSQTLAARRPPPSSAPRRAPPSPAPRHPRARMRPHGRLRPRATKNSRFW